MKYTSNINAPDFPEHLQWLNTDKPLTIESLKGKVVLLDFWTYCCINCIHVIPDLKRLEEEFAEELVVIGVHSAKFRNEQEADNIREAILRYEIEHPVINDRDFEVWNSYAVRAWPSFVIINPRGKVVAQTSGEGIYDRSSEFIREMIEEFDKVAEINKKEPKFALEKDKMPKSLLSFPGKIIASEKNSMLYFTDSNNDRVIISTSDGKIVDIIGSGEKGSKDGNFDDARLFRPQGLALDEKNNILYIADTENHLVRAADLTARRLATVAGTGQQGSFHETRGNALDISLNSPWDLFYDNAMLYIAMAGNHQIWTLDIENSQAENYAGSGRENITDGNLFNSNFAQPSGIDGDKSSLYIADSEVSGIRMIDRETNLVKTLIGTGLFDFGDIDGKYPHARLQHAIGVTLFADKLYIADTYNHKIRQYDLKTGELSTFAGTGTKGYKDATRLQAQFNEPNDMVIAFGKMYVTDTNNDLIRVIDMESGEVNTMTFSNPEKLAKTKIAAPTLLDAQSFSEEKSFIKIKINLPKGHKITKEAPSFIKLSSADKKIIIESSDFKLSDELIEIPARLSIGKADLLISGMIYYCEESAEQLCYFKELNYKKPIEIKDISSENIININL